MGRLWSPEDSGLSSSCVPGTLANFSTAPTLGFPRTNGRAQRGSVWGPAAWPATVHRGLGDCTLDHGSPPWTWLCLSPRLPCTTLKSTVNIEEGLTLRVIRLSVCVCLAPEHPWHNAGTSYIAGQALQMLWTHSFTRHIKSLTRAWQSGFMGTGTVSSRLYT